MKLFRLIICIASALSTLTACSSPNGGELPVEPDKETPAETVIPHFIYQANPRAFAENGGLNALAERIPEISEMGVDILWIMPVFTLGEEKAFASPYCIRDFNNINSRLGTLDDFHALVDKAHAAGLKVMLDWVANHTSWDHSWIKAHPEYYVKDASGNISQANVWTDVAQLDFKNAALRAAMIDAMKFWVTGYSVDGFRCDYADGPGHTFWKEAVTALRNIKSDIIMLAESGDKELYNDGFDMIYGWAYAGAATDLFKGKGNIELFFKREAEEAASCPEGKTIMRYALNHDTASENAIENIYGSYEAIPAAYFLTAMLGQTPMIYSIMESDVRSGKVSFFEYKTVKWNKDNAAIYTDINKAVRDTAPARSGKMQTYHTGNGVTISFRNGDNTALVLVNPTGSAISVKTPIEIAGSAMRECIEGIDIKVPTVIELQPYAYKAYYK